MPQSSNSSPPGVPLLQAVILEEIVGPQSSSHMAVDELGLAMATDRGSKRSRNEDRIAAARIAALNNETYTVALVCDGVGGSEAGDQAAALTISNIIVDLAQQQKRPSLKDLAVAVIQRADEHVRKELQGRGTTTLVMLLATASGHLVCANVGDSRAYSWDPSSKKLDQVTIDDTIENELKDLPGNPAALIKARGLQGRLSQAIGEFGRTADELRVQLYTKELFRVGAVLGSDGLWRAAMDFEATVANAQTPIDAVRRSIALANWVGGVDNASLIVVDNVERLCGGQKIRCSAGSQQQTKITLWQPSGKIKFLKGDLQNKAESSGTRAKPEAQKRRNPKKKERQENPSEAQLELAPIDSKDAKPKIEVTVSEEPTTGKGNEG